MNLKKISIVSFLILFLLSIGFSGCKEDEETSEDGPISISIPNITISCKSPATDCDDDSADFKLVAAVFYQGDSSVATGVTDISCTNGICTGTINSWINPNDFSVMSEFNEGDYNVYVGIDTDGNDYIGEVGEPESMQYVYSTLQIDSTVSNVTIDNWTDAEDFE